MSPRSIICIVLLALIGCSNATAPPAKTSAEIEITYQAAAQPDSQQSDIDLQLYIDPQGRYSVKYPKAWVVAPSDVEGFDAFFVENSSDGETIQSYLALSSAQTATDLNHFGKAALAGVQDQDGIANFELQTERAISVNGLAGLEHIMTYAIQDRPLAHRAAIIQEPNHIYSVSLVVYADQLQSYKPAFDAVLQSFQIQ